MRDGEANEAVQAMVTADGVPPVPPPRIAVSAEDLAAVRDLYEQGLYLQAFHRATAVGPLRQWTGAQARILAGRLAYNLGDPSLGRAMNWLAYREAPAGLDTNVYYAVTLHERRGPLAAWEFLKQVPDAPEAEPDMRVYLHCIRARLAALFRDFESTDQFLRDARAVDPANRWIAVEESFVREQQDRYADALDMARRSVEGRPWYRPGIQSVSHALQLLGREDESLELLREADRRLECCNITAQFAGLLIERGQYAEALDTLRRYEQLAPLLNHELRDWLRAQRARLYCELGDLPAAAAEAAQLKDPYFEALARRLAAPAPARRAVRLAVGFVRQHHVTCVPATLSALSQFWNQPADHLELAEAICYDGTPAHSERHWAETHGWHVREFTVRHDVAVALLDRGIPFALITQEASAGHMQAVIGYDSLREVLILRDPYQPFAPTVISEPFFKRYEASGPRGLAMVPADQAARLDGLDLPDAPLYDALYRLNRALFTHRRDDAQAIAGELHASHPGHRLTLQARWTLAGYDANPHAILQCAEELLALFPKDAHLQLTRLSCLHELERRDVRLGILETLCADSESHPVFLQYYAQELRVDARQLPRAIEWKQRALFRAPMSPDVLKLHADLLWDQRRFREALEIYRFLACLEDRKEFYARAYFFASRPVKETDRAMAFLEHRVEQHGGQSADPAITLFTACEQLDRMPRAFEVLDQALARRPDDGELLLFAADACARFGRRDDAGRHLEKARGRSQELAWLKTAASLADYRGEKKEALVLWQQDLALEPLSVDANRAVALLLAETEGTESALRQLAAVCGRFPHHYRLHQLWLDWLRSEGPARAEPVIRHLIEIDPADPWSRRELAIALGHQHRFDEALAEAELGVQSDPNNPYSFCTRGQVHLQRGRPDLARDDFRAALRLAVDVDYAIHGLMATCQALPEHKEAIQFIEQELIRQVVFGDAVLAFRDAARGLLKPEELLESLRSAHRARPDLWHAWSALVMQLVDMQQRDEALELATEATQRFPLLPRLWYDLAIVRQARLDRAGEQAALEQALLINPAWGEAVRHLSSIHQRNGEFDKAIAVLEGACARTPLDSLNHGWLAELLWHRGDKEPAIQRLETALRLNPEYEWAWDSLCQWTKETGQPQRATQFARDLVERRGDAHSWLLLAESLMPVETAAGEMFKAIERAIEIQPRNVEAHDLKAVALFRAHRHDEAMAACRPAVFAERRPTPLRFRAAWIEFERGNLSTAVADLRALMADQPDYLRGWQSLADWHWRLGDFDAAVHAAQQVAQLLPLNAVPLGYLGDLKRRKGDTAGARADFQRALALDPSYGFAGCALIDLQIEAGELDAAGETLGILRQHLPATDETLLIREATLACRRRQPDRALEIFRDLCRSAAEEMGPIEAVATELRTAGCRKRVRRIIAESLQAENANPALAEYQVQQYVRRGTPWDWWRCFRLLRKLADREELGRRALSACVAEIGDETRKHPHETIALVQFRLRRHLSRLIRRHGPILRRHTLLWGNVGYALLCQGRIREAARWMADWKERKEADMWMLNNVTIAYHIRGMEPEAAEVVAAALRLPRYDHTLPVFKYWAATDAMLEGRTDAARDLVKDINPTLLKGDTRRMHDLLDVLFQAAADGPRYVFSPKHRLALADFYRAAGNNRHDRRVFFRAARHIARVSGRLFPAVWAYGRAYGLAAIVVLYLSLIILFSWLSTL